MRPHDAITERLWNIAEPVCAGAGYELVDLALTQTPSGWVLRVMIDQFPESSGHGAGTDGDLLAHPSGVGARIGFADCERVSRELSTVLDVEDPIKYAYNLEVSSPGLDRPLRTVGHFERFVGQVVKVTMRSDIGGRRNFKGTLISLAREGQGGEDADGGAGEDAGEDTGAGTSAENPMTLEKTGHVMVTISVDGTEYRLPFNDIENARLVPDWDVLFARGQQH
jgi:ribosome maturation factor RimP